MEKNNNIEKFFRKRLESQEFPYNEEDWQKLEKRLDAEGPVAPKRINGFSGRTMFFAIVLLTSSFLLGWFARGLFTNEFKDQSQEQIQNVIATISEVEENNSNDFKVIKETNEVYVKNQKSAFKSTQTNEKLPNKNAKKLFADEAEKETKFSNTGKSGSTFLKEERDKEKYSIDNSASIIMVDEKKVPQQYSLLDKDAIQIENSGNEYEEIILLQYLSAIDGKIDVGTPRSLILTSYGFDGFQFSNSSKMTFGERWLFGVSLATDFNSIGMHQEKSLSAKIGGQLYFLITPNWWVSAGIQYSNKKYNTSSEYYSPGNGYWTRRTNGVLPDNIFGTCSVFDIPVMVTYRFFKKDFISFTASAGASNYLLQDEIYEFEFDQENPGAATGWQTAENSMAPFSVGNIYLGVEWQTSQRTFLVVEPFLQIPFKEVGWGNVKIYSTGLQAKIKYKIGNP